MKRLLGLVVVVFLAVPMLAQESKAGEKEKGKATEKKTETPVALKRWQGKLLRINKEKSTLDVRGGQTLRDDFEKTIHYDSSTRWTKGDKDAEQSEFTEGSFVIVVGKADDKGNFHAERIDLRPPR
ncbi:MAG TPA: hypothetical protein VLE48_01935 [Terriglobales bacterium]|nr:hypothetical protein [Terriglobales bacterium]